MSKGAKRQRSTEDHQGWPAKQGMSSCSRRPECMGTREDFLSSRDKTQQTRHHMLLPQEYELVTFLPRPPFHPARSPDNRRPGLGKVQWLTLKAHEVHLILEKKGEKKKDGVNSYLFRHYIHCTLMLWQRVIIRLFSNNTPSQFCEVTNLTRIMRIRCIIVTGQIE